MKLKSARQHVPALFNVRPYRLRSAAGGRDSRLAAAEGIYLLAHSGWEGPLDSSREQPLSSVGDGVSSALLIRPGDRTLRLIPFGDGHSLRSCQFRLDPVTYCDSRLIPAGDAASRFTQAGNGLQARLETGPSGPLPLETRSLPTRSTWNRPQLTQAENVRVN